jgi:hypothetical protein
MNTYRLIPACRGTLHKIRRVFRNKRLRELFAATTVTPPNNSASHPELAYMTFRNLSRKVNFLFNGLSTANLSIERAETLR